MTDHEFLDFDRPVRADPDVIADLLVRADIQSSVELTEYARRVHGLTPPEDAPADAVHLIGLAFDDDAPDAPGTLYWLGPDPSSYSGGEWSRFDRLVSAAPDVYADLHRLASSRELDGRRIARYAMTRHGLTPPSGAPLARWEIELVFPEAFDVDMSRADVYWVRPYPDAPDAEYLERH